MQCPKCEAKEMIMLVRYDFIITVYTLKCIICGKELDPTIMRNSMPRSHEKATMPPAGKEKRIRKGGRKKVTFV